MAQLETLIEDARWTQAGLETLAQQACDAVLSALDLSPELEISLMGCDDTRICELNGTFRDKPTPTNVLSWPSEERATSEDGGTPAAPDLTDPELGDIAIAYDTCAREADAQGKPFEHHVTHLIAPWAKTPTHRLAQRQARKTTKATPQPAGQACFNGSPGRSPLPKAPPK